MLSDLCLALFQGTDGRAELEAMLERFGRLRNVEITLSKSARDQAGQPLIPSISALLLYESPQRFRYATSTYWGGGATYISDGVTLKVIPAEGERSQLRRAGRSVIASHSGLGPGASDFAMSLLFLEGKAALVKLLPPGGRIQKIGHRLEFATREFGHMTIFLSEGLPTEIIFDNAPQRWASYRLLPTFSDRPEAPLEVEALSYRRVASFPSRTFDTRPKKGEAIEDLRKTP